MITKQLRFDQLFSVSVSDEFITTQRGTFTLIEFFCTSSVVWSVGSRSFVAVGLQSFGVS